jgi:hypothetical protein
VIGALEARGFGAVLALTPAPADGLPAFLAQMAAAGAHAAAVVFGAVAAIPQQLVDRADRCPPARRRKAWSRSRPAEFDFVVGGIEVEGQTWAGVDVQYPWESTKRAAPPPPHADEAFFIDRTPVTNAQFKAFMDASGYRRATRTTSCSTGTGAPPPAGTTSRSPGSAWRTRAPTPPGPASACRANGNGSTPRRARTAALYPWGDSWNPTAVPPSQPGRTLLPPADVDAHPHGASPFGVMDLVGNVWQWTDEFATSTPVPRCCAAAAPTSRRPRTGTSPGLPARPAWQVPADGAVQGPLRHAGFPLRRGRAIGGLPAALQLPSQVRLAACWARPWRQCRRPAVEFIRDGHSPAGGPVRRRRKCQNLKATGTASTPASGWWRPRAPPCTATERSRRRYCARWPTSCWRSRRPTATLAPTRPGAASWSSSRPSPRSWDGAPAQAHLGHLDPQLPHSRPAGSCTACSASAPPAVPPSRIGDLCLHALTEGGIDITDLGNHHGMSATVLFDPAAELYFADGGTALPRPGRACS